VERSDVLQHLLLIENEAAELAVRAQVEADRRLEERDRAARAEYGQRYAERAAALEADYARRIDEASDDFRKTLDRYREELERGRVDDARFSELVRSFLSGAY